MAWRDHPLGLPVRHRDGPPGRDPGNWRAGGGFGRGAGPGHARAPGRSRLCRSCPGAGLDRRGDPGRSGHAGRAAAPEPDDRGGVQRSRAGTGDAGRTLGPGAARLRRHADRARGDGRMAGDRVPDRPAARRARGLAGRAARGQALVVGGPQPLPVDGPPARPERQARRRSNDPDRLPAGRDPRPRAAHQWSAGPDPW